MIRILQFLRNFLFMYSVFTIQHTPHVDVCFNTHASSVCHTHCTHWKMRKKSVGTVNSVTFYSTQLTLNVRIREIKKKLNEKLIIRTDSCTHAAQLSINYCVIRRIIHVWCSLWLCLSWSNQSPSTQVGCQKTVGEPFKCQHTQYRQIIVIFLFLHNTTHFDISQ